MKPLNEELKEIRLEKGFSLHDISDSTKIAVPSLEKLENGDYSFVPQPYIRAFLKEYAEALGISRDTVIARYENRVTSIKNPTPLEQEETITEFTPYQELHHEKTEKRASKSLTQTIEEESRSSAYFVVFFMIVIIAAAAIVILNRLGYL